MPKIHLPDGTGEVLESPHDSALNAVRERRESEQLIADWEGETRRLGHALALMTLDISAMTSPKWDYRFVITVVPVVEDWSFLFYGTRFASLMELPERPSHSVSMVTQLPVRYVPVLTNGCIASTFSATAVRMHGTVRCEDGGEELYRAAFIRLNLDANRQQHFVLGVFNCRLAKQACSQRHETGKRIKPVLEVPGYTLDPANQERPHKTADVADGIYRRHSGRRRARQERRSQ
jgi:hypothetical protein